MPEDESPENQAANKSDFMRDALARLKEIQRKNPLEITADEERDLRERLRKAWSETIPTSPEDLEKLILSPKFGSRVREAIVKTDDMSLLRQGKLGQEFGFAVFHHLGGTGEPHISSLLEGDETSINLNLLEEFKSESGLYGSSFLMFHTHPSVVRSRFREIFTDSEDLTAEPDYFSEKDHIAHRNLAARDNTSVIEVIGIKKRDNSGGKLVFVSFNNFEKFADFNPKEVSDKSIAFKESNSGVPEAVYRESGLNVAVINVVLEGDQVFNPQEVKEASRILSHREPA